MSGASTSRVNDTILDDIDLIYEAGTLRHIDRAWRQFGGLPFANVAEHSSPPTRSGVRQAIEAVGAHLRYLPAYSPDFNPIENAFAKLKALLRTAAARTIPDLWDAIREAFTRFKPDECRNYLAAAGYDAADPA